MISGSVIRRQIEVQDRMAGSTGRKSIQGVLATQSAKAARLLSDRAIRPDSPPTDCAHFRPSIASSTAIIDGVLMVSPLKMPSEILPSLVRRKILGIGHAGL